MHAPFKRVRLKAYWLLLSVCLPTPNGRPTFARTEQVLFDCKFDNIEWIQRPGTHSRLVKHMHTLWSEVAIKAMVMEGMLRDFDTAMMIPDTPTVSDSSSEGAGDVGAGAGAGADADADAGGGGGGGGCVGGGESTAVASAELRSWDDLRATHSRPPCHHIPLLARQTSTTLEEKLAVRAVKVEAKASAADRQIPI
jgi:hypothetical protein